jgi:hypothetical protein
MASGSSIMLPTSGRPRKKIDLAHHVAAHVGALGEDAAAQTGEDGDQRGAEAQRHQRVDHVAAGVLEPERPGQHRVVPGHADQREAGHQQARDGAGAEGHRQALLQALGGRLGRAHVGAHRDQHPGEARQARQHRADQEAGAGQRADQHAHGDKDDHAHHGDGGVLPLQVGLGPFLNGGGDLLHPGVARGGSQQRCCLYDPVQHCEQAGDNHQQKHRTHV